jgi:hypothetical protein
MQRMHMCCAAHSIAQQRRHNTKEHMGVSWGLSYPLGGPSLFCGLNSGRQLQGNAKKGAPTQRRPSGGSLAQQASLRVLKLDMLKPKSEFKTRTCPSAG